MVNFGTPLKDRHIESACPVAGPNIVPFFEFLATQLAKNGGPSGFIPFDDHDFICAELVEQVRRVCGHHHLRSLGCLFIIPERILMAAGCRPNSGLDHPLSLLTNAVASRRSVRDHKFNGL